LARGKTKKGKNQLNPVLKITKYQGGGKMGAVKHNPKTPNKPQSRKAQKKENTPGG